MEVYGIKPIDSGVGYGSAPAVQTEPSARHTDNRQGQGVEENPQEQKKELNREKLVQVTDKMNSLVQMVDTDIKFKLHEKTKNLMVQVVNVKSGEVIKEFPPHELLDVMAKISEYVGSLLDKKA